MHLGCIASVFTSQWCHFCSYCVLVRTRENLGLCFDGQYGVHSPKTKTHAVHMQGPLRYRTYTSSHPRVQINKNSNSREKS